MGREFPRAARMNEFQKSQTVRVFDVLVLGPFMVYAASRLRMGKGARAFLAFAGVATVLYNARNYLLNRSVQ
jgi:hypothetical protein